MRINNPVITREILKNKILKSPYYNIIPFIQNNSLIIKYTTDFYNGKFKQYIELNKNLTQKEIIELYYKL